MRNVSFRSLLPMGGAVTLQIENAPTEAIAIRTALEHFAAERIPLLHLDLSGLDLQQANLDGLLLEYCNLNGTNISGATMRDATLQNCDLQNITTSPQTKLTGSTFLVCNFSGALLAGVQAGRTNWAGSKLTGAHAAGLIAPESNFRNCRTLRADFRGAVLAWSDVSNMECKAEIVAGSAGSEIDLAALRLFNERGCSPLARADIERCIAEAAALVQ